MPSYLREVQVLLGLGIDMYFRPYFEAILEGLVSPILSQISVLKP